MKLRIQAQYLQHSDIIVGSGEVVKCVQVGIRTPKGKLEIVLAKNNKARCSFWGKYTLINVEREEAKV